MSDHEAILLKLAVRDDTYVEQILGDEANQEASHLDAKTRALVRVAAMIAVDAAPPSYMQAIEAARASFASNEEIVGCLVALLPVVGVARVVSAAPKVGLALGYDVEAALESHVTGRQADG